MKIHHLNCASLCPIGGRLVNGPPARMVCHCLIIETNSGLVLVDTGLSLQDIRQARIRLGMPFLTVARPALDESETAVEQVGKLGFEYRP